MSVPIRFIYRWDLDKTYLETDFRLHRIWQVPFQSAESRRNIPGAVALLRELTRQRRASDQGPGKAQVSFISGSPRQLRGQIEAKFKLDGLSPDALHLKPNLENLVRFRWRALREQVGYKLPLLLEARVGAPVDVHEACFGDDSETNALIYSLYADLVAGKIGDFTLREMMRAAGAYPDAILRARDARRRIQSASAVDFIIIHLAMRTPPERFRSYGPRVIPVTDYFQAALVLFGKGHLEAGGVVSVAYDMMTRYGFGPRKLARSFKDIMRRGFFLHPDALRLAEAVEGMHFPSPLPPRQDTVAFLRRLAEVVPTSVTPPPEPQNLDYPSLIETLRHKVQQAERQELLPEALQRAVLEAEAVLASQSENAFTGDP